MVSVFGFGFGVCVTRVRRHKRNVVMWWGCLPGRGRLECAHSAHSSVGTPLAPCLLSICGERSERQGLAGCRAAGSQQRLCPRARAALPARQPFRLPGQQHRLLTPYKTVHTPSLFPPPPCPLQVQNLLALCGEHIEADEGSAWKAVHQSAAVLGLGLIAQASALCPGRAGGQAGFPAS